MTQAIAISDTVQIDPDLVRHIGHEQFLRLTMIVDRLPRILGADSVNKACKEVAGEIPGLTSRSLYNRVNKYKASLNPLDLVDRRECAALWKTAAPVGLPRAFREFYRGLREKHQRVFTQAHAELITIWRTHYDMAGKHYDRIPGYEEWPSANPATGIPHGWSYDNLQTSVPEHIFDTAAKRQGMATARLYQPPVRTTRVGLKIGERVEFDDHDFDQKVHFPGQSRAMRPQCFGAVDALSGFAAMSVRPTLWDDVEESKRVLTEFQFRCFHINWMMKYGFRNDDTGSTHFTEAAKAILREPYQRRLHLVTGGKVSVNQGRVFSETAYAGQFSPRGKGNPKHKPLIEGLWCLFENLLDRLPGQIGSNQRINGPAEMHGREVFLARSLDLAKTLPPDLAEQVILGVMPYRTFAAFAKAALDSLLDDPGHNLEGWEELGFSRMEWRSNAQSLDWMRTEDFARLPETEQMAVRAILRSADEELTRSVRLTRREVMARYGGELTRLGPIYLHRLLNPEDGFPVRVTKQSTIEFQDVLRFGPGEFWFRAECRNRDLYPGDKFDAFFNPLNPGLLQIVDGKGAPVALLERIEVACKNDEVAIGKEIGRRERWTTRRTDGMALRHFDETETRAHWEEHHRNLVAEAEARKAKAGTASPEMDRLAKRAKAAGPMVPQVRDDGAIEGEVIDEVIEAPIERGEISAVEEERL